MLQNIKRYFYNILHPQIGEVWQLHRVTDAVSSFPGHQEYEITPQRLEHLILTYRKDGYKFVSVEDVRQIIKKQDSYKFVAVTLDDGYADNFQYAYPIFRKYNIPFCVFITKNFIDNGYLDYKMMTTAQLIQIASDQLCTIGGHTVSHPRLSSLDKYAQRSEICECNLWLEKTLGRQVTVMAYPYGDFSRETLEIVANTPVNMAFAAWGGALRKHKQYHPLAVPRLIVR